mmetsp:Transcript_38738/g.121047  ORF Transcript_38738/g.121047 Transcript_38738/m.121047 type:complete len:218 (-) Transcript_38738:262-915(-)
MAQGGFQLCCRLHVLDPRQLIVNVAEQAVLEALHQQDCKLPAVCNGTTRHAHCQCPLLRRQVGVLGTEQARGCALPAVADDVDVLRVEGEPRQPSQGGHGLGRRAGPTPQGLGRRGEPRGQGSDPVGEARTRTGGGAGAPHDPQGLRGGGAPAHDEPGQDDRGAARPSRDRVHQRRAGFGNDRLPQVVQGCLQLAGRKLLGGQVATPLQNQGARRVV